MKKNTTLTKSLLLQIFILSFSIFLSRLFEVYIQFPVFYSWLSLPTLYLKLFSSSHDTIYEWAVFYIFAIPFIFYFISLIIFFCIKNGVIKKLGLNILFLLHFIGSFTVVMLSKNEKWLFFPKNHLDVYWITSLFISLILSLILWNYFFEELRNKVD